jgi:hypothetical protein
MGGYAAEGVSSAAAQGKSLNALASEVLDQLTSGL